MKNETPVAYFYYVDLKFNREEGTVTTLNGDLVGSVSDLQEGDVYFNMFLEGYDFVGIDDLYKFSNNDDTADAFICQHY